MAVKTRVSDPSHRAVFTAKTRARKRRKRRHTYYAPRRVPHAFPPGYLRRHLLQLTPLGLGAVATHVASILPFGQSTQQRLLAQSEKLSTTLSERSQRLYFDTPGLDTLTVRQVGTHARRLLSLGAFYLRARIVLGWDKDGRAAEMLPLIPTRDYDALMVSMLVAGTAVGYFKGGKVHANVFYDDAHPNGPILDMPQGHTRPSPRRLQAPTTLTDLAADIDDLYWAVGHGQPMKITAVGDYPSRRWLVSLPGTVNTNPESTPNPADTEANIREVLNLPSGMRVGTVRALHHAMRSAGVEDYLSEPVLICGHSQGGMVATALASMPPEQARVNVQGVLALGTPSRRMRIREDVTMLAVAHDQDVIPSIDGSADRVMDHRVTVRRHLNRPRKSPLYYAHASMTYTETVRGMERKAQIAPWGRVSDALASLSLYLPKQGEHTRVFFYDVWQEILEPTTERTWNTVAALSESDWQPVEFNNQWTPAGLPVSMPSIPDIRKWWNDDEPTP